MKKLCIYHVGCFDGFGAAYAVWRVYGDLGCDFHPAIYGQEPPDVTDREVIIVDFSYKRDVMLSIVAAARSVVVLDHHKTAQAELEPLLGAGQLHGVFDMNRSGAMIAWQWFHNTPPPELIRHIEDRDLWRFKLDGTREIIAALGIYKQDFTLWHSLMNCESKLQSDGVAILKYQRQVIDKLKEHAVLQNIGGYDVPVVNAPWMCASDVAGELSEGHPFAATYYDFPDGRTYSLRSREGGIDVSKIAASYGGGGHARAAGFKANVTDARWPE